MKTPYTCPNCASHCTIAYEWDTKTQSFEEMDGMLCASGITALVSMLLFGEQSGANNG